MGKLIHSFICVLLGGNLVLCAISSNSDKNSTILDKDNSTSTTTDKNNDTDSESLTSFFEKKSRNPKFGFQLPVGIFPQVPGIENTTPFPNYDPNGGYPIGGIGATGGGFGGIGNGFDFSKVAGVGIVSTAALIKAGVLGGAKATLLKAAILPPLFIGAVIIFLVTGAGFFICNVVGGCGNIFGGIGSSFGNIGSSFSSFFNRNSYEPYGGDYSAYYQNQLQPVYQAIEEGYKKYD